MFNLERKVAIVTGSSRGIGRAIAEKLAAAGASLVLNGISDPDALARSAGEIAERHGVECLPFAGDVSDAETVSRLARAVFERFKRLDVLVNNAGILAPARIGMIPADQIDEVLRINLKSVILCTQAMARLMERGGGGSIVNLTSIMGTEGAPGFLVYGASKGGVAAATRSAAKELAPKRIRVNALAPGYVDTDMVRSTPPAVHDEMLARIGLGRIGAADDVANAALFLAGDLSAYITGQVIGVDGGMLI